MTEFMTFSRLVRHGAGLGRLGMENGAFILDVLKNFWRVDIAFGFLHRILLL